MNIVFHAEQCEGYFVEKGDLRLALREVDKRSLTFSVSLSKVDLPSVLLMREHQAFFKISRDHETGV